MKAGLIGEKLSHSLSPEIHSKFFRLTGISGSYSLFETGKDDLGAFLDRLMNAGFTGVNVTIPYKTQIIQYLDGLSDTARAIGAVNTVLFKGSNKYGCNTDYFGLKALLEYEGISVKDSSVAILGTGGAARCALKLTQDMGAAEVIAVSRNPKSAGAAFKAVGYDELEKYGRIDVLINATPAGMTPGIDACPVSEDVIKRCGSVVDLIYNPAETVLLKRAREHGVKAANGLLMLCAQAVKAQEIWTEREFGESVYSGVYEYMKAKIYKTNIVLIGMPGSGKTTVGKLLAQSLKMEFADTDAMVEAKHGAIPDIFRNEGEAAFREYEREAAQEAASMQNTVISTGGGIILDEANMSVLRQTGTAVFLDRPLDVLLSETDTSGRPLLADGKKAIERLYKERHGLYEKYADITVDTGEDAQSCAQYIICKLEETK